MCLVWTTGRHMHFSHSHGENPERLHHVIEPPLKAGSSVLDIGSDPERSPSPLPGAAPRDRRRTCGGMVGDGEYAAEGVSNLDRASAGRDRPGSDLDSPYDIVLASYSLGMPDIRAAIEAMCEVSSGWVYLFWFAGTTAWEQAMVDLWPKLHGEEFQFGPKVNVLYNVLYSMGIYPNVEMVRMNHTRRFPGIDAAVNEFREQYRITSPAQEELLREYLATRLLRKEGDDYLHSGATTRVRLWWEVNGCR